MVPGNRPPVLESGPAQSAGRDLLASLLPIANPFASGYNSAKFLFVVLFGHARHSSDLSWTCNRLFEPCMLNLSLRMPS